MELHDLEIDYGTTRIGPVSAEFPAGHVTVLRGGSGSGKTSLCLAMTGFLTPTSGHIRGERGVLVPQNPREWLNPRHTVAEVIDRTADIRGHSIDAEERIDILSRALLGPELLDHKCGELSGGQAARVCLARALASGADTIICDEPTAALDASNAARFARLIRALAEAGNTIVWATHDLPLVMATNANSRFVSLDD
ncbi:ATP-binding cassette domain-containing protein [Brevibacterium zhoupengii]|uniref:ATP-binding cassette domain-containing protein n=1 Tax=Brevibacterium zhoupengii TaxID=2898795 RepID=UPI001E39DED4|nr:ATP-binding cassette domain-containing protein [Brevibacterium zhoupengii]